MFSIVMDVLKAHFTDGASGVIKFVHTGVLEVPTGSISKYNLPISTVTSSSNPQGMSKILHC